MLERIQSHPTMSHCSDIDQICKPLHSLNITYFAHVLIDKNSQFSAITNNPAFTEHYLSHQYYNADIHMAAKGIFGEFLVWDYIERCGNSAKMDEAAEQLGVQHTFTITETDEQGDHYYHFANNASSNAINQVYLSNLDLLKLFIPYFKENVQQSAVLRSAYDLKFFLDEKSGEYCIQPESLLYLNQRQRLDYLQDIISAKYSHKNTLMGYKYIVHVDTKEIIPIPAQQAKCFLLTLQGKTTKQISAITLLSIRTIENYLQKIRKLLHCRSSKELLAKYISQANLLT